MGLHAYNLMIRGQRQASAPAGYEPIFHSQGGLDTFVGYKPIGEPLSPEEAKRIVKEIHGELTSPYIPISKPEPKITIKEGYSQSDMEKINKWSEKHKQSPSPQKIQEILGKQPVTTITQPKSTIPSDWYKPKTTQQKVQEAQQYFTQPTIAKIPSPMQPQQLTTFGVPSLTGKTISPITPKGEITPLSISAYQGKVIPYKLPIKEVAKEKAKRVSEKVMEEAGRVGTFFGLFQSPEEKAYEFERIKGGQVPTIGGIPLHETAQYKYVPSPSEKRKIQTADIIFQLTNKAQQKGNELQDKIDSGEITQEYAEGQYDKYIKQLDSEFKEKVKPSEREYIERESEYLVPTIFTQSAFLTAAASLLPGGLIILGAGTGLYVATHTKELAESYAFSPRAFVTQTGASIAGGIVGAGAVSGIKYGIKRVQISNALKNSKLKIKFNELTKTQQVAELKLSGEEISYIKSELVAGRTVRKITTNLVSTSTKTAKNLPKVKGEFIEVLDSAGNLLDGRLIGYVISETGKKTYSMEVYAQAIGKMEEGTSEMFGRMVTGKTTGLALTPSLEGAKVVRIFKNGKLYETLDTSKLQRYAQAGEYGEYELAQIQAQTKLLKEQKLSSKQLTTLEKFGGGELITSTERAWLKKQGLLPVTEREISIAKPYSQADITLARRTFLQEIAGVQLGEKTFALKAGKYTRGKGVGVAERIVEAPEFTIAKPSKLWLPPEQPTVSIAGEGIIRPISKAAYKRILSQEIESAKHLQEVRKVMSLKGWEDYLQIKKYYVEPSFATIATIKGAEEVVSLARPPTTFGASLLPSLSISLPTTRIKITEKPEVSLRQREIFKPRLELKTKQETKEDIKLRSMQNTIFNFDREFPRQKIGVASISIARLGEKELQVQKQELGLKLVTPTKVKTPTPTIPPYTFQFTPPTPPPTIILPTFSFGEFGVSGLRQRPKRRKPKYTPTFGGVLFGARTTKKMPSGIYTGFERRPLEVERKRITKRKFPIVSIARLRRKKKKR